MVGVKIANDKKAAELAEWRRGGWTVLFSALGYGSGPILFLVTASVFIRPTMDATGWSTSEVLLSPVVSAFISAMGPIVGRIVDRRGARLAILLGLIPYITLLVLFTILPMNRVIFYALGVGIGFFGAFGYFVPYGRAVASWFDKSAGKAFGMVAVGGTCIPLLGIPLVTLVIYKFDWQAGYLVLAAFALMIALPSVVFGVREKGDSENFNHSNSSNNLHALDASERIGYSDIRQILFSLRYWVFVLHIFFIGGATTAFLTNLQPIMLDGGLDVVFATTATTICIAGIAAAKVLTGILIDIFNRYAVAVFMFTLSVVGAAMFANIEHLPTALIVVAVLLTSAAMGAEADLGAYFMLKEYGRKDFATLFATAVVFAGVGSFSMSYVYGFLRDTTGGYSSASYLGSGLFAGGAIFIILYGILRRPNFNK